MMTTNIEATRNDLLRLENTMKVLPLPQGRPLACPPTLFTINKRSVKAVGSEFDPSCKKVRVDAVYEPLNRDIRIISPIHVANENTLEDLMVKQNVTVKHVPLVPEGITTFVNDVKSPKGNRRGNSKDEDIFKDFIRLIMVMAPPERKSN